MPGYRLQKINRQLQIEISNDIRHELKDPRIHSVTIIGVETAPDLASAKVFVSFFDPGNKYPGRSARECVKGLDKAAPYLRELLRRKLTLKKIPRLIFKLDDSIERGVKILNLINELELKENRTEPENDDLEQGEETGNGKE